MTAFYLRDINNSLSGSFPTGEQGAGTPTKAWAGSGTLKNMSTTKGSAQASKADTVASASAQRHFIGFWCSDALAAQTIGAQTWTLFLADWEDSLSANYFVNLVNAYVWRPGTGAKVGTLIDGSNGASQGGSEATSASSEQVTTWTFSGASVTCQAGDVLIVELWSVFTPAMSNTYSLRFYYDGTVETGAENAAIADAASKLSSTNTITFNSAAYSEPVNETVTNAESVSAVRATTGAVSETVSLFEALQASGSVTSALSESIVVSDSMTVSQGHVVALSETDTLSELVGAALPPIAIGETVTLSEALAAGLAYVAAMEEGWAYEAEIQVLGRATLGDRRYPRARQRPYRTRRRH